LTPQILSFAETPTNGRAVVRLASGECIRISVLRDWCFIKQSKYGLLGRRLYIERGPIPLLVAGVLADQFWNIDTPAIFNLMLQGCMKGVCACSTSAEVEMMFRRVHEHVMTKGTDAVSDKLFR